MTGQQRNERAPGKSNPAHQPVEQIGGTWQVAGILEHQDEEKQDDDLRQKHEHGTRTRDHAIGQ